MHVRAHVRISLCACLHVLADMCTTEQVHGKLLASTTDKTTSGTRVAELMGEETQKKEGEGEKTD